MKNRGIQIICWLRRIIVWIMHPWLFMLMILVVIVALVVSFLYCQTELSIKISGLMLQVFGLITTAIGIQNTRKMFEKPSFLEQVRIWIKKFPRLKPCTSSASLSVSLPKSTVSIKAYKCHSAGKNPTIESRFLAVEANLNELRKYVSATETALDDHIRSSEQRLREETDARQKADQNLHLKIEATSTDGLHLATVGLIWLMIGVVMSTIPNELLGLFK